MGFDAGRLAELRSLGNDALRPGRVVRVDRGLANAFDESGDVRVSGLTPGGLAVGDWIAIDRDDRIAAVLQRRTELSRRVGHKGDTRQVVAANVDLVMVVRPLDLPVRLNRLQALSTMASASGAKPVFILTKADVVDEPGDAISEIERVIPGALVLAVSVVSGAGVDAVRAVIRSNTVVLLGESGAGKSSLTNALVGEDIADTGGVRRDRTGRHTTTHRSFISLVGGGGIIDTPGIRQVFGFIDDEAIAEAFDDFAQLSDSCRFPDCSHTVEPGCAVTAALESGEVSKERYEGFLDATRAAASLKERSVERSRKQRGGPSPRHGRPRRDQDE